LDGRARQRVRAPWRAVPCALALGGLVLGAGLGQPALAQSGPAVEPPSTGRVGAVRRGPDGKLQAVKPGENEALPAAGADALVRLRPYQEDERRKHQADAEALQRELDRRFAELRRLRRQGGDAARLTDEEDRLMRELQQRDRRVREHEERHFYVGQPHTRPPEYWTVLAPDGRRYAVMGLVPMDVAPVPGDPAETRRKWETLLRAALAPADPSERDQSLAREPQLLLFGLQTTEREKLHVTPAERAAAQRGQDLTPLPDVSKAPALPPAPPARVPPPRKAP